MDNLTAIKAAVAAVLGALTAFWGWFGWLACLWVGLMLLDYLSGTAAACQRGEWSSAAARSGVWHKAGEVVVVLVAACADLLLGLVLDNLPVVQLPVAFRGIVCPLVLVWYCITELGSIIENAVRMGAPVPAWLTKLLQISLDAVDGAGEQAGAGTDDKTE